MDNFVSSVESGGRRTGEKMRGTFVRNGLPQKATSE
jgi:hypothetical protein